MKGKHGGNVYQTARQLNLNVGSIIDFSANINPLGISPRAKKISAALETAVVNYPDQDACDYIKALSGYHDLPEEYFIAGNGSTEFIYILPGIIRPKSVLIVTPVFTEYEYSYQQAKGVLFYLNLKKQDKFRLQKNKLFEELKRGYSALYICNPCNPTGAVVPAETMREIVAYAGKKGTAVVLDETCMDYAEKYSMKRQVPDCENLYVLRSMTKFFALPGLRIGYCMSNPKNLERIREKQAPWSLNAFAQLMGTESLKDGAYIQRSIAYVNDARAALARELKKIPHVTVFESCANFLLLRLQESARRSVAQLYQKLLDKGIMIRTCEDFYGLDDRYFRLAVKKKNENRRLITELKKILN